MQEFGQSVLDELIGMMQKRLDMFTEETQKGYPVKDITSYRKYTGKKMPRILVVADEFQVLFSEAHNRRVANTCATRLADIISLYRVSSNVSYHKKLMTLIESGYTCGFNVVMSCPDFISIKEIIYECIPKFQNRILFALSDKDADRIISEARVENLKSNIALYYDGVNPAYQFKPYDII